MDFGRIILLAGHYGSGKTNIAVTLAKHLRAERDRVMIADIDVVNPYFRTTDSRRELEEMGILVAASPFAGSNVDLPALPQEVYAITDDPGLTGIIDVGGDDRGALALGRWRDAILAEPTHEMLLVINGYRPLTRNAEDTKEILQEITVAGGIPFTGIVNNSNLGALTTARTVLDSLPYAQAVSEATGLPVKMTAVEASLYDELKDRIPDLFPMTLQKRPIE